MKPKQLNLFTGKHPADNIIERLTKKINAPKEVKIKEVPSIRFIKYL